MNWRALRCAYRGKEKPYLAYRKTEVYPASAIVYQSCRPAQRDPQRPGAASKQAGRKRRFEMAQYRLTVDTGGTFSDFVYVNDETREVTIAKFPSTPDDPSRAILAGVEDLTRLEHDGRHPEAP